MQRNWFAPWAPGVLGKVAKVCGLLLVLAATAATARADLGPAPEIDPGSLAGALTVLTGGLLIFADRRRRK
jgi:hypothetical protein